VFAPGREELCARAVAATQPVVEGTVHAAL
jgi:hypothetical protein